MSRLQPKSSAGRRGFFFLAFVRRGHAQDNRPRALSRHMVDFFFFCMRQTFGGRTFFFLPPRRGGCGDRGGVMAKIHTPTLDFFLFAQRQFFSASRASETRGNRLWTLPPALDPHHIFFRRFFFFFVLTPTLSSSVSPFS